MFQASLIALHGAFRLRSSGCCTDPFGADSCLHFAAGALVAAQLSTQQNVRQLFHRNGVACARLRRKMRSEIAMLRRDILRLLPGLPFAMTRPIGAAPDLPTARIMLIATPSAFVAAREAMQRSFSGDRMPEGVAVGLRMYAPYSIDAAIPAAAQISRSDRLDAVFRGRSIVTLGYASEDAEVELARRLASAHLPVVRLRSTEAASPIANPMALPGVRHDNELLVDIPGLWAWQLEKQFAATPKSSDGSCSVMDIERTGHSLQAIFLQEQALLADVAATALTRLARGDAIDRELAELRCTLCSGMLAAVRVVDSSENTSSLLREESYAIR